MAKFVYLAGPYSHPFPSIRKLRFDQLNHYAARLMECGVVTFSPISHSHVVAEYMDPALVLDHDHWMRMDLPILEAASCVVVVTLPGWKNSRGVRAEIEHAEAHAIPVILAHYEAELPLMRINMFMSEAVSA